MVDSGLCPVLYYKIWNLQIIKKSSYLNYIVLNVTKQWIRVEYNKANRTMPTGPTVTMVNGHKQLVISEFTVSDSIICHGGHTPGGVFRVWVLLAWTTALDQYSTLFTICISFNYKTGSSAWSNNTGHPPKVLLMLHWSRCKGLSESSHLKVQAYKYAISPVLCN